MSAPCAGVPVVAVERRQVRFAAQTAYATSFPDPTKRFRSAGWYFSSDRAFELAAACALDFPAMNDPRPQFLEAIVGNFNYEAGCNPVNISFVSGLGWKRPREMVNQYAQNDRRVLPPTGLPFGNIQEGFPYLENYKKELGVLTFPSDGDEKNPYPFYDRWGDTFNTSAEFVTVNVARSLATAVYLMTQTSLTNQAWRSGMVTIVQKNVAGRFSVEAKVQGVEARGARFVWETAGEDPFISSGVSSVAFAAGGRGSRWVELEASLPDGRRFFASTNFPGVAPAK